MDEAGMLFDNKPMDFAALLKSAQSAIAAAQQQQQQQQQQHSGDVTPQHSDAAGTPPLSATTSPIPNNNKNNNNIAIKNLNENCLMHQNQIINALKHQSLVSPITQLALNSLSPFVPMRPVYAPSGYGRQILIYDSRSHPGRRREFAYKTRFTNQSGLTTVYYRCMACRALRHRLQRVLPKGELPAVPCIAVKNDMLINDPDFPEASNHFCSPLTIEQSNDRLKATFERGFKRARMKMAAEDNAAIKRPALLNGGTPTQVKNEIDVSASTPQLNLNQFLWSKPSESASCTFFDDNGANNNDLQNEKLDDRATKRNVRYVKDEQNSDVNVDETGGEISYDMTPSTATAAISTTSATSFASTNPSAFTDSTICKPLVKATNSGSPRRRLDQLLRIRQQQLQEQLQQQQSQYQLKGERDKSTSPDENQSATNFAQKLIDYSNISPPDFLNHFSGAFASANRSVNGTGVSSLSGKSTPNASNYGNGGIEATTFGEISGTISSLFNFPQLNNETAGIPQGNIDYGRVNGNHHDAAIAENTIYNHLQQAFASRFRGSELLRALNNNNNNNNHISDNNNNHNDSSSLLQNESNCMSNTMRLAAALNPNFMLDFLSNNNNNNNSIFYGNGIQPNEHLSEILNKYVKSNWDLPENAGNSRSAAELTCTLILALARHVPQAAASMKQGKWSRKDFMGEEVHGKTLAIIGLGRIGQEVASRMQAFGMKTIGFDPLVSSEDAEKRKIKWLPLEEIWPIADYITVHVPLIAQTQNLLSRETFAKCKQGVRVVNVARGGIINEEDLYEALNSSQVGGAALDVFCEEPPSFRSLIDHPKVVCTPHLGASTLEAQQRVAVEIAENIAALNAGAGLNGALNGAALAAVLDVSKAQFVRAVSQLSQVLVAIKPTTKSVIVRYPPQAEGLQKALNAAAIVGLLKTSGAAGLNLINAEMNAAKEGITVKVELAENQNAEFTVMDAQTGVVVAGYASPSGTMISAVNGARVPFAVLAAGNLAIAKNDDAKNAKSATQNDEKLKAKLAVEFSLLGGGHLALFNQTLSRDDIQRLSEYYNVVQFEDNNNNNNNNNNNGANLNDANKANEH